jgi:hypothetical protein
MGKQIQLHMLASDCRQLLQFVQERDPVVMILWNSSSSENEEVLNPCSEGGTYCLWNQAVLPYLKRKHVTKSDHPSYYRVDSVLPVIEFSYPGSGFHTWNERSVLMQGRIWAGFEQENRDFERWYEALVRWIRKKFVKNPVPLLSGYAGPCAFEWYKKGGLLLPMVRPPVSPQWLSWAAAQDQHRATLSK